MADWILAAVALAKAPPVVQYMFEVEKAVKPNDFRTGNGINQTQDMK
jgi:hypothetical protein